MPHSLARVYLHLVFTTKHRQPFLADAALRGRVHRGLATLCTRLHCSALEVGGVADHVHVLCTLARNVAVADLVKELKRRSSHWLRTELSVDGFAWQVGYGAFSVSPSHVPRVVRYVRAQEAHHLRITLDEELDRLEARSSSEATAIARTSPTPGTP